MTSRLLTVAALILATLVLVALLTQGSFTATDGSAVSTSRIALMLGYLVLVSGAIYGGFKENMGQMFKYAAVWVLIGGVLAIIYQVTH